MDVLNFYNAISSGELEKIRAYCNKTDSPAKLLNHNVTYAMGATFILPLPLIIALEKQHWDVAKYLIELGADLDLVCKRRGKTPREFLPPDFLQQKE